MTWLPTKKAAELERVSSRTMCRNKEQYEFRPVNGVGGSSGTRYEFLLESLSDKAQARYRGEQAPEPDILQFTGKQREGADFRALVVTEYQRSGLSPEEYVLNFNSENPPEDAITTSKLFRWQRQYSGMIFPCLL